MIRRRLIIRSLASQGIETTLGDTSMTGSANGGPRPAKGDRQLLVRLLEPGNPADPQLYTARPSSRLETFERSDTLLLEAAAGVLGGWRTFDLDKSWTRDIRRRAHRDFAQVSSRLAGDCHQYDAKAPPSDATIPLPLDFIRR